MDKSTTMYYLLEINTLSDNLHRTDLTVYNGLSYNTRFIQFGQKYKAFAKAVALAKDNYFRFANV